MTLNVTLYVHILSCHYNILSVGLRLFWCRLYSIKNAADKVVTIRKSAEERNLEKV
jgi:hypothetical protein